jgi:pyruvate,water dikinase
MQDHNGFTPPGPGVWELEATHMVRPVSRALASFFPEAATAGFKWSMARYGMLLDHLEFQVVNRFVYICARGVGAPKGATKGPPPKLIFKLLTKIHPEIRKRIKTIASRWPRSATRSSSRTCLAASTPPLAQSRATTVSMPRPCSRSETSSPT